MGALLVRCSKIPSEFDDGRHPLLRGDGTYTPSPLEAALINRLRLHAIPVLLSFVWTALVVVFVNGFKSQVDVLVALVPILVQAGITMVWPESPRVRSFKWVQGMRLTLEFFLVLLVGRLVAWLAVLHLLCSLTEEAFSENATSGAGSTSRTAGAGSEACTGPWIALASVFATVLYAAPTLLQLEFSRQLLASYSAQLQRDGADLQAGNMGLLLSSPAVAIHRRLFPHMHEQRAPLLPTSAQETSATERTGVSPHTSSSKL